MLKTIGVCHHLLFSVRTPASLKIVIAARTAVDWNQGAVSYFILPTTNACLMISGINLFHVQYPDLARQGMHLRSAS